MKSGWSKMVLVASAMLCFAVPARSAAITDRPSFSTSWRIQTDSSLVGVRTVAQGKDVLRQRLLPSRLFVVADDVFDGQSGRKLLSAGDQLFDVAMGNTPIMCLAGVRDPSGFKSFMVGGGNRQQCFVDSDSDHQLDGFFTTGNAVRGLPNFSGRLPRNLHPTRGGRYSEISPEQMKANYWVAIQFFGKGRLWLEGRPVFSIRFGNDESQDQITDTMKGKAPEVSPDVNILGARLKVVSVRSDSIDIDVINTMPDQPFGVEKITKYTFY